MPNPSARVYIIAAIIGAIGIIIAAWIGRSSGIQTGQEQAFATASIQESTSVAQNSVTQNVITQVVVTQVVITEVAITEVVVTEIIATSPPAPTPEPVVVIATPTLPPPTPEPDNTPAGSILQVGETWKNEGAKLTLVSVEVLPDRLLLRWRFVNDTGKDLLINYSNKNFTANDNLGQSLVVGWFQSGDFVCNNENKILKPEESAENCGYPLRINANLNNSQITEVIVTASDMPRIPKAQWKILISIR